MNPRAVSDITPGTVSDLTLAKYWVNDMAAPHLALVFGQVRAQAEEICAEIYNKTTREAAQALAAGDRDRARTLLERAGGVMFCIEALREANRASRQAATGPAPKAVTP